MIYDFKCKSCGNIQRDVILPLRHTESDRPVCCGATMPMFFDTFPQVHWKHYELEDGGFIAHGLKGRPVITSLKQRKDVMERHEVIDANDFGQPQTKAQQMEHFHTVVKPSIDAITPPKEVADELRRQGLDDIVSHHGESNAT